MSEHTHDPRPLHVAVESERDFAISSENGNIIDEQRREHVSKKGYYSYRLVQGCCYRPSLSRALPTFVNTAINHAHVLTDPP